MSFYFNPILQNDATFWLFVRKLNKIGTQEIKMDQQPKKLYRSTSQRMIAGICGGLGEYLNIDPTIMRIAFVAGFFLSGTLAFWAYLIMWIVVPEAPFA